LPIGVASTEIYGKFIPSPVRARNQALFDQLVVLCRQLEQKGYFMLAEKQTPRSGSMAPEVVTIHALRPAAHGLDHLLDVITLLVGAWTVR
jgi:hypothetical protein